MSNTYGTTIDFLSLSFRGDDFGRVQEKCPEELARLVLSVLKESAPFHYLPRGGFYNYAAGWTLYRDGYESDRPIHAGLMAFTPESKHKVGLTNSGLLLSLSGAGCHGLDLGKLVAMLEGFAPRITRIDLAIDYYQGEVDYQRIAAMYHEGAFAPARGPMPLMQPITNQRLGKEGLKKAGGYSLYIGKKGGSKLVRAYEKAHQLANMESIEENLYARWFRLEIQVRSADCEIPLGVFEDSDAFLAGLYPNLFPMLPPPAHVGDETFTVRLLKLDYKSPPAVVTIEHLTHYGRIAYGPLINVFRKSGLSNDEIVEKLTPENPDKVPHRLQLPA